MAADEPTQAIKVLAKIVTWLAAGGWLVTEELDHLADSLIRTPALPLTHSDDYLSSPESFRRPRGWCWTVPGACRQSVTRGFSSSLWPVTRDLLLTMVVAERLNQCILVVS